MAKQPLAVFVAVTVYVVVTAGFAVGFDTVDEVKPVVGDQLYVTPATALDPIVAPPTFCVHVFVKSVPAFATGNGFTVTKTISVFVHPVEEFVPVTVYVVVDAGANDTPLVTPFVQV